MRDKKKKRKAKAMQPRHSPLTRPPNRSLKRTRGYVLAPWLGFPAAPLSSGVRPRDKQFYCVPNIFTSFLRAIIMKFKAFCRLWETYKIENGRACKEKPFSSTSIPLQLKIIPFMLIAIFFFSM